MVRYIFRKLSFSGPSFRRGIIISKKGQITEALVDIAALFFLILLFVVAFMLVGSHRNKITKDFVNQDMKGLSLEYVSLNLVRQSSTHGQISDEVRLLCKDELSKEDLTLEFERVLEKIVMSDERITLELKDETCTEEFEKKFVNIPAKKKQTNCVNSYKTQIIIANIKQSPIILDVSQESVRLRTIKSDGCKQKIKNRNKKSDVEHE